MHKYTKKVRFQTLKTHLLYFIAAVPAGFFPHWRTSAPTLLSNGLFVTTTHLSKGTACAYRTAGR